MSRTLLSISGKARVGKSSLAQEVCARDGYVLMSWADALREEVREPHNIAVEYDVKNDSTLVEIDEFTTHDKSLAVAILYWMSESPGVSDQIEYTRHGDDDSVIRYVLHRHRMQRKDPLLLQWWGTEFRRYHFGHNYWVDKLMDRVTTALRSGTSVVIDDTRFPNEVDAVRRAAHQADRVISIRIEREHPLEDTGRDDAHESENMLNTYLDWDMILHNEGSIDQLYATFKAQETEDIFAYSGSDHVVRRA